MPNLQLSRPGVAPARIGDSLESADDSSFISIADFYALLSLTILYVIVSQVPKSGNEERSISVSAAMLQGEGPASVLDSKSTYVAMLGDENGASLMIVRPGGAMPERHQLINFPADELAVLEWSRSILSKGDDAGKVVFFLDTNITVPEVHRLFNRMISETQLNHEVEISVIN